MALSSNLWFSDLRRNSDYTSVKFDWGLILDQSLTGIGEMYFIAN